MAITFPKNLGSIEQLIKRCDAAKSLWNNWRSLHQEAYDYSMPDRETMRWRSPGQTKNRHVYDSTAVEGLDVFANKVQGGFFPDWLQWMEFRSGVSIPKNEKDSVNKELEEITEYFFGEFHQSNFSTEISPALKDWGIGTGAIDVEEGRFDRDDPLFVFTNVPLAEVYPEKPASGAIKTSFREFEIEVGNIKQNWPEAELPNDLEKIEKDKPHQKIKLINGHVYDPKENVYHQVIIYKSAKKLLYTQKFKTKRRIVFRSSVTPGEVFGRGPVIRVLADIRSANKAKEFILKNAAIQVAGVYTGVDDGIFNPYTTKIAPGTVIPVSSNDSRNPTLAPLNRSGDVGLGGMVLEDLQETINRALFAKPMGDISDPVRSATEQMIRHQEDLKRTGTSFGRLYSELVVPLVQACVDIAKSRGKMPDVVVDGKEVKIKMVSPLARQKDVEEYQALQTWVGFNSQLPEAVLLGSVKLESLPAFSAEKLGVPASLVRSEEEQKQMAEAAAQAAQAQLGGQGGGI